jgi:hypothetical protein
MEEGGMTVEDQKRVIDGQVSQMEDNEQRREAESERGRQWNEYEAYLRAQGDLKEAEWRRRFAKEQQELCEAKLAQERELKARQFL